MFKYRFDLIDVEVWLDVSDGNDFAETQWSGPDHRIESVKRYLNNAHGAFGHLIDADCTSPIDLDCAIAKIPQLQDVHPQLIEGAELVASYDPDLPEGAVT
jgi:hypothetical protein